MPLYSTQTTFSFADRVANPAQISVFNISGTTGISTSMYLGTDYTANWVDRTITLTTPLVLGNKLRIDVYEVGNGDQLVKSNSQINPIRTGSQTGLCEIYLACSYTGTLFSGSGVVISGTVPENVVVSSTDSTDETMLCDAIDGMSINNPIKFTGVVFGNILADTVYYIKTLSVASRRISVSSTLVGGIAGPVFELATATGTMSVTVQTGTADVYSPPIVSHNGVKLSMGAMLNISSIRGSTSGITCNTTTGLLVGSRIVFSNTIFGGIIQPLTSYYIESIIDDNEFTISTTLGGAMLSLTTASGGAVAVTNDYAFSVVDQSTAAKIVFASTYDHMTDFISYSVFGQTTPVQYGFTLPITEFFDIAAATTTTTATTTGTNLITVTSTGMLALGDTVIFTGTTFGNLVSGTTYYVKSIDSIHTLTVSAAVAGVVFVLTTASGSCVMTDTTFSIVNYVGGSNPSNAIVEKNGLRLTSTAYSIDMMTNTLELASAPTIGDVLALTSYNLTDRQYMHTEYGITGKVVSSIVFVNNEITAPLDITNVSATAVGTNLITCDNTLNFVVDQTVIFQVVSGLGSGGIAVDGTVYYIKTVTFPYDGTFTISATQGGPVFALTTGTTAMVATVGGTPAVRVQTAAPHSFVDNDLVRIDGTQGSVQINNTVFYAKKISATSFDLYSTPYSPVYTTVNSPVTDIFTYVSGGYTWIDRTFTIQTTTATASTSVDNWITVASAAELVTNTQVTFTAVGSVPGEVTMGGLVIGTTYYIVGVDTALSRFTVSESYIGPVYPVTTDTSPGIVVTQWEQTNVDRLWVTINGHRVPSSSLRINPDNNLSILVTIATGDEIIITNMVPTATPNELVFRQSVTKDNIASVYRANQQTRTWLTAPLYSTDSIIHVMDVLKVTDAVVQNTVAPAPIDGEFSFYLAVDKRIISQVLVYNLTTEAYVDPIFIRVGIEHISPMLYITGDVLEGQSVVITTIEGNLLYVNGEQIRFTIADVTTNTLSGLQRGANGTGQQDFIPEFTEIYGVLSQNKLPDALYLKTYAESDFPDQDGDVDGGPLQFFDTPAAVFLQRDIK